MLLPIYHSHPPFSFSLRTLDSSSASPFSLPPPLKPLCCLGPRFSPKTPELLSKSAIQRITEKLQSLGYVSPDNGTNHGRLEAQPDSPGEIFISRQLPARHVGHTIDDSWSSPDHPQPLPGAGPAFANFFKIKRELDEQMRREKELAGRENRAPAPTLAELTIPEAELRRLRSEGIRLEKRLKVGKAGVTEGIVNGIHERWRRSELVKIKCEDLCRMNMKRTHETLERKTGGLVIWRSGSIIVLYRGANYKYPYFVSRNDREDETAGDALPANSRNGDNAMSGNEDNPSLCAKSDSSSTLSRPSLVPGVGSPNRVRFSLPAEMQLEEEANRLLDGLGPRFTDWWGYNPLPVDADLLPAFVPGYRRPFRLLPYGVKPKLTDREMTVLRRLGRPLPCHFALGRNRNLQGLAVAMIKLWEKCEIAKIAVKRGVQNTNSDMMAEELKAVYLFEVHCCSG